MPSKEKKASPTTVVGEENAPLTTLAMGEEHVVTTIVGEHVQHGPELAQAIGEGKPSINTTVVGETWHPTLPVTTTVYGEEGSVTTVVGEHAQAAASVTTVVGEDQSATTVVGEQAQAVATTTVVGEEGPVVTTIAGEHHHGPPVTTTVVGEEGPITTTIVGEQSQVVATTTVVGEEGPVTTTIAGEHHHVPVTTTVAGEDAQGGGAFGQF